MVFGGKFRIRRCNSKASYLPRQSLEKLNNSDPDHGSYKLTLTSNEDLVATTKPSYDIITHNGNKLPNNLPDVLPLGAKLQPQSTSPTSSNVSLLRYGSNNNLAHQQTCYPMYPSHNRYSTPVMNSYSNNNSNNNGNNTSVPSYARSQSYDINSSHNSTNNNNSNNTSPTKFMSQSTIDLKKTTHSLETTLEETMPDISTVLSPAQSENNLNSPAASKKNSPTSMKSMSPRTAREQFQRPTENTGKIGIEDTAEGRIFRAELVNTTLCTSPNGGSQKSVVIRKDSLRENIEKITQLQSKLMSAHLSDNSLLNSYNAKSAAMSSIPRESTAESDKNKPVIRQSDRDTADIPEHASSKPYSLEMNSNASAQTDNKGNENGPLHLPEIIKVETSVKSTLKENSIATQLSQMDSSTDGLKLMQRSEIILRVNPTTTEAASQTDDLPDCDMGRLTLHHNIKEDAQTRITLQPRQRHPIELDCDTLSKELAKLLTPNDKLIDILMPQIIKSPADYISDLYNPNVPQRPAKRDVGTSTLMRMKSRDSQRKQQQSPERSTVTVELQYTEIEVSLTNGNESESCDLMKNKVDELMRHIKRKIQILNSEQKTVNDESALNDELGRSLINKLADKVRPIEATKFRAYIDDVGHITSLLLSLSERLARAENTLSTNSGLDNNSEKKTLETKRDRLLEQLDEAKRLKEDIKRRGASVTGMLENHLTTDELVDFEYFINMKAKLITDGRDIADKVKCSEEQLNALSEALIQSDC